MPTRRSYGDACGVARALDVVGERWALLVVRELLLSPQRFSDLRGALPNAASNIVSDRLRELEDRGVIERSRSRTGTRVYELTEWGRELEPIVLALGGWGLRAPKPPRPTISATSALLFLRGIARPDPSAEPLVCRLELDGQAWTVAIADGRVEITPGEPHTADAELNTDPQALVALLEDPDPTHVFILALAGKPRGGREAALY
jgi:DNA-binding HxlR family transcriptional regulator